MPPLLALELYHLFIQRVDENHDLLSLALCCSAFRDEAQRWLFRDATLPTLSQHIQFLSAINGAPLRLGPSVHSYYVGPWSMENVYAVAVSEALLAMCSLKHLELSWPTPSRILRRCTFKLRTLTCPNRLETPEFRFMVTDFLLTQKFIEHLEIHSLHPVYISKPPSGLCPQLQSISTTNETLPRLLLQDTRLITHFQWFRYQTPPPLTIPQLNHLKSLAFSIHILGMDTSFITHLISLVDLKLNLHMRLDNADHLLHPLLFLDNLPHLQVLILDLRYCNLQTTDTDFYVTFATVFQRAFELCPQLKHIDITYNEKDVTPLRLVRQTTTGNDTLGWKRESLQLGSVNRWMDLM